MGIDVFATLDASVKRHNMLEHPFYQAWAAGKLPVPALADYARDWGALVRLLDRGWETVGQAAYAQDEREHTLAWEDFAGALDTAGTDAPQIPQLAELAATAERLFAEPATALGALYAFEVQQPQTAISKRDGLQQYYALGAQAQRYFELHAGDYAEAEWLKGAIAQLDSVDQLRATVACERMCIALWDGLSGVYNENCASA